MLYGISIVLVSMIAVSSLLLSRQSNAIELLSKIKTYQWRVGLVAIALGTCQLINWYVDSSIHSASHIWSATLFLTCLMQINLGWLLGFPVIRERFGIVSIKKIHYAPVSWAYKQGVTGVVALALGVWTIVASFIYEN